RRVERVQHGLHAQNQVEQQHAAGAEEKKARRVALPVHLHGRVDRGESIESSLERAQCGVEPGPLAAEDPGEIAAERSDQQCDDQQEEPVLDDARRAHDPVFRRGALSFTPTQSDIQPASASQMYHVSRSTMTSHEPATTTSFRTMSSTARVPQTTLGEV